MNTRTIWKFNLAATDRQKIRMPEGAKILAVAPQDRTGRSIQMWAWVNPAAVRVDRAFAVVGTGNPVPPDLTAEQHIGSVVAANGHLVWHVFETDPSTPGHSTHKERR